MDYVFGKYYPTPEIDNLCWEKIGIGAAELLDHYFKGTDRTIKEFRAGEHCQYKDSNYDYLVVECGGSPGWRISHIWDNREDAY